MVGIELSVASRNQCEVTAERQAVIEVDSIRMKCNEVKSAQTDEGGLRMRSREEYTDRMT